MKNYPVFCRKCDKPMSHITAWFHGRFRRLAYCMNEECIKDCESNLPDVVCDNCPHRRSEHTFGACTACTYCGGQLGDCVHDPGQFVCDCHGGYKPTEDPTEMPEAMVQP